MQAADFLMRWYLNTWLTGGWVAREALLLLLCLFYMAIIACAGFLVCAARLIWSRYVWARYGRLS